MGLFLLLRLATLRYAAQPRTAEEWRAASGHESVQRQAQI